MRPSGVQLPFGMMGAMTISGEYTSGMIDATLVATPSRGRVPAAKAMVLSGAAVAGSLLIATGPWRPRRW
ncbi:hypothetical protein ACIBI9_47895 [Nonomuraea sp. NPDC050451]|uniref:hypothetical protein n=1 Tax=Nonomuraea sp. NPDC050451 TaxID=3364364 RepID=UPI0037966EE8